MIAKCHHNIISNILTYGFFQPLLHSGQEDKQVNEDTFKGNNENLNKVLKSKISDSII